MQLDGFTDRVALVTGAAQGIGAAIAAQFSALGARVAVADLTPVSRPGELSVQMDVADAESVDAGVRRVVQELGPPSILVLNAGIFRVESFESTSPDSWRRMLEVNLTGAYLCARAVLPHMREAGYGRVVSIGSSAGITGGSKHMAAYGASKAGIMALAKALSTEYAPYGITSNALAPALIDTDMADGIRDLADRIPVGRLGTPADVAAITAFLCSAHAGYITGAVIDVNGGFLLH